MILEQNDIYRSDNQSGSKQLIEACLSQVDFTKPVVKINTFYRADDREDYNQFKMDFNLILKNYVGKNVPVLNFIGQLPIEQKLEIEVISIIGNELSLSYSNELDQTSVIVLNGKQKNLYVSCSADSTQDNMELQVGRTIDNLDQIIANNDFLIQDIKRQWNYIEGITACDATNQNYQLFNNKRSEFFSHGVWDKGYPAATGIGSDYGTIIIDTVAVKGDVQEEPIDNPLQVSAHQYSKEVLVGEKNKRTPKFERAKLLHDDKAGMLYVSGTAAIRGEASIADIGVEEQTQITIENIQKLLDDPALFKFKEQSGTKTECGGARVYLKHSDNLKAIKDQCISYFGEKIIFLEADVCRDDLLIEIEAIYTFNN